MRTCPLLYRMNVKKKRFLQNFHIPAGKPAVPPLLYRRKGRKVPVHLPQTSPKPLEMHQAHGGKVGLVSKVEVKDRDAQAEKR